APAAGRTGGGVLIPDGGEGRESPEVVRFTTRLRDGVVTVEQEGAREVGYPVRVRGGEGAS
ncbi:hypothetical protein, partial [Streptomyces albireticuli]